MKLACCRRRVKVGLYAWVVTLMVLFGVLTSCAKKTAPPASNPAAGQLTTQPAQSLYGRAAQHAIGVAGCQPNLEQVRQSIQMYHDEHDGQFPPSLDELHLPPRSLCCPVSKQEYQYDPTTGEVKCTFPGHEHY